MDIQEAIMKIDINQFMIYEEIILSGQINPADVSAILAENPDFLTWYRNRAVIRQNSQKISSNNLTELTK